MRKIILCLIIVSIAFTGILSVNAFSDNDETADEDIKFGIGNLDSIENNRNNREIDANTDSKSVANYSNEDNNSAVESITENSEIVAKDVTISLEGDKKMDLRNTTEIIMANSDTPNDNSTDKNDLKSASNSFEISNPSNDLRGVEDTVSSWDLTKGAAENIDKDLGFWAVEFTFCVF